MKWNYGKQLLFTVLLIFLSNVLSTLLQHWIYRNIGFFLCGLIWLFHPVMAGTQEPTKKQLNQIRFWCSGILFLIAIFTRSYAY